jgi:MYXO-CTERM domain-containing protein
MVRNTFGLVFTSNGGQTWRWMCEDVLGLPTTSNEDPYVVWTQNLSLVIGISLGLEVSSNAGCDWAFAGGPLQNQLIKDLDGHPSNLHDVDLITSTFGDTANVDGGQGYVQQLFQTTDDGATWTEFGTPIDPTAIVTTLDVAPTDTDRLYVSAYRGDGMQRTGSLFVSSNRGMTWTEHQTPLNPNTETAIYIGAVDPNNEDLVYLRTEGQSRLIVTSDGGQTFNAVKTMDDEMLGLALSPDGSKIYIGSVMDGLLVSATQTFSFTQTSTIHVQCLATQGANLWACSDEVSGFVAGVSQDDGKTFTPKLHLLSIESPIGCGADAAELQCDDMPFGSLCAQLGACYPGSEPEPLLTTCICGGVCDGGPYVPDAQCPSAKTNGDSGGSSSHSGCACSTVGGGSAFGFLAATGVVAAIARARRRTKRS